MTRPNQVKIQTGTYHTWRNHVSTDQQETYWQFFHKEITSVATHTQDCACISCFHHSFFGNTDSGVLPKYKTVIVYQLDKISQELSREHIVYLILPTLLISSIVSILVSVGVGLWRFAQICCSGLQA